MITLKQIVQGALFLEKRFFRTGGRNNNHYYIYRKGDFSKDKNRQSRLVWQLQGKRLFLSCPGCGGINEVRLQLDWLYSNTYKVRPDGHIEGKHCLTCPECRSHFFVKLRDWKGSEET